MVVFPRLLLMPSASALPRCRCGISRSSPSKKKIPSQKPTTAGTKDHRPMSAACSIAGSSRLQMEAATMTPAAKPVSARCTISPKLFRIKKTQAAPSVVPAKGISSPCHSSIGIFSSNLAAVVFCKVDPDDSEAHRSVGQLCQWLTGATEHCIRISGTEPLSILHFS